MAKSVFFQATPQQQLVLGVGATKCLNKFDDYLFRVKGVAPSTRKIYCLGISGDPLTAFTLCAVGFRSFLIFQGNGLPAAPDRQLRITVGICNMRIYAFFWPLTAKSEGSIRMMEGLGFPWTLAAAFRVMPLSVRDWLYELVARNRFRLVGRRATCYFPTSGFRDRFL